MKTATLYRKHAMNYEDFACPQCGSQTLIITGYNTGKWDVTCGNNHLITPMTGLVISIRRDKP